MSRKKYAQRSSHSEKNAQEKPLDKQAYDALRSKCAFGSSKHDDAKEGVDTFAKIYSHSTFDNYYKESKLFVRWCQARADVKTLEDCRDYRLRYIQSQIDRGMSASTVKKRAAALGKLYGESILGDIQTPDRKRVEITRSRDVVDNDARFRDKKYDEFKEFCRSTGLRRHEFAQLEPGTLQGRDGDLYLVGIKGKGGKLRDVPVVGNEAIVRKMMANPKKYFSRLDTHMDIHGLRSEYACRVYKAHERPLESLKRSEKYFCRSDMAGYVYDREAMLECSRALGHNRIEVVASNYLYNLNQHE